MIFDEFDQIHADEELKKATLRTVMQKQKQRRRMRSGLVSLGTVCVLLLLLFQPWNNDPVKPQTATKKIYSYITLDINPSMEWQLDEKQTVVDVHTYNQDAKNLLKDVEVKGLPLQDALNNLMKDDAFQQYLNSGFLEVSVYSKDSSTSLTLEEEVNSFLSEHISQENYHCSHLDEDTHHEAREHHVSGGKYRIMEDILSYDSSYTLEDLQSLSMKDLYELLAKYTQDEVGMGCHDQEHHNH